MLKSWLLISLLACSILGAGIGAWLTPSGTYSTSVGEVQVTVRPAIEHRGQVSLYVPVADWGVRAKPLRNLMDIHLEPRRVDRKQALAVATGDEGQIEATSRQINRAVISQMIKTFAWSLVGGLLGGLFAMFLWEKAGVQGGSRLRLAPLGGMLVAAVFAVGNGALTALTFDSQKLQQPTYYASGDELANLLNEIDHLQGTAKKYKGQVQQSVQAVAGLLTSPPQSQSKGKRVRMVLASDLHNNRLVFPALRDSSADAEALILAGDFVHNGSQAEAKLLKDAGYLSRNVIGVSGNHDSRGIMRELASQGMSILTHAGRLQADGTVKGSPILRVKGLTLAGFEDPLEYTKKDYPDQVRTRISFSDFPEGEEMRQAAIERYWDWWKQLPERPQILILHQSELGRELAKKIWQADSKDAPPLTILSGHTHRQRVDRVGKITVVDSGTAGAGGLLGVGKDQIGWAQLQFSPREGKLLLMDMIRLNPLKGSAQATRVNFQQTPCEQPLVVCQPGQK